MTFRVRERERERKEKSIETSKVIHVGKIMALQLADNGGIQMSPKFAFRQSDCNTSYNTDKQKTVNKRNQDGQSGITDTQSHIKPANKRILQEVSPHYQRKL